jgi:hypothetical protein
LLVSFDVLACNISKSGPEKKKEKVLTQIKKTHSPSLRITTRSMGHTTRETYKKERYSQRERERSIKREREIEEFPHTTSYYFLATKSKSY